MGKEWTIDTAVSALNTRIKILEKLELLFKRQLEEAKKRPDLEISGLADAYLKLSKKTKWDPDPGYLKVLKSTEKEANESTIKVTQKATSNLISQVLKENGKGPRAKDATAHAKELQELSDDLDYVLSVGKKRK